MKFSLLMPVGIHNGNHNPAHFAVCVVLGSEHINEPSRHSHSLWFVSLEAPKTDRRVLDGPDANICVNGSALY